MPIERREPVSDGDFESVAARRAAPHRYGRWVAVAAATATLAGCGSGGAARSSSAPASTAAAALATPPPTTASPPPTAPATTASPTTAVPVPTTPATTAPAPAPTTASAPPPFTAQVTTVTVADLPYTWHPGCPVAPDQLRMVHLPYWGFDGSAHSGRIVVNSSVVPAITSVFRTLYDARFPLAEVVPEDAYHGDDNAAAAADDTSGFNCRYAVAPGPPSWSVHAYGEAIDVNDVQNPYIEGSTVIPPSGVAYENRSAVRPGMAVPGGTLVGAFAAVGWEWGGRWTGSPDYQHFSATGG